MLEQSSLSIIIGENRKEKKLFQNSVNKKAIMMLWIGRIRKLDLVY